MQILLCLQRHRNANQKNAMNNYLELANDATFFSALYDLDVKISEVTKENSTCRHCSNNSFYYGNYLRKPRGLQSDIPDEQKVCFSLRCTRCRRRHRVETIRFTGRRVYISLVFLILPAVLRGDFSKLQKHLKSFNLSGQTVKRWMAWWGDRFKQTLTWKKKCLAFLLAQ